MFKRILVLAPHTDDGELGCGGAVARFLEEGREVYQAVFSAAARSLPEGLPPIPWSGNGQLPLPPWVSPLGTWSGTISRSGNFPPGARRFWKTLLSCGGSWILIWFCCRPWKIFTRTTGQLPGKESGPLSRYLSWATSCPGIILSSGTTALSSCRSLICKKAAALACYRSQSHRKYCRKEFVLNLAGIRGAQIGADFAELFNLIRLVIK